MGQFVTGRISYIIPFYNNCEFLAPCIESILSETYPNFEIVVIDDGSELQSSEILAKMMTGISNARIIYQENQGPGVACNTGVNYVSGEYLRFVHHDDLVPIRSTCKMIEAVRKNNTDFCVGRAVKLVGGEQFPMWIDKLYTEEICSISISQKKDVLCDPLMWNKLFKRAWYNQYVAPFPPRRAWEDILPSVRAFVHGRFSIIAEPVYIYRIHNQSITRKTQRDVLLKEHMAVLRTVSDVLLSETDVDTYNIWLRYVIAEDLHIQYKSIDDDQTFFLLLQGELRWLLEQMPENLFSDKPEIDLAFKTLVYGNLKDYFSLVRRLA